MQGRVRKLSVLALLCGALVAPPIGKSAPPARAATNDNAVTGPLDRDPLRRFLPRSDIFMPVPGGVAAVSAEGALGKPALAQSIEERMHNLHGGLVVGYCLRASCSRSPPSTSTAPK